jgi:hypothetical protein
MDVVASWFPRVNGRTVCCRSRNFLINPAGCARSARKSSVRFVSFVLSALLWLPCVHAANTTTLASVITASATTLTVAVPSDTSPGAIQAIPLYCKATSSTNLVVPPTGYTASQVQATASTTENAGITLRIPPANLPVSAFFKGTQGGQAANSSGAPPVVRQAGASPYVIPATQSCTLDLSLP